MEKRCSTHAHTVRLLPPGLLYPRRPYWSACCLSVSIRFHLLVPSLSFGLCHFHARSHTHTEHPSLRESFTSRNFCRLLKGTFSLSFFGCAFLTRERESLIDPTIFQTHLSRTKTGDTDRSRRKVIPTPYQSLRPGLVSRTSQKKREWKSLKFTGFSYMCSDDVHVVTRCIDRNLCLHFRS